MTGNFPVLFSGLVLICVSAAPSTRSKFSEKQKVDDVEGHDVNSIQDSLSHTFGFKIMNLLSRKDEDTHEDTTDVPKIRVPAILPGKRNSTDPLTDCGVVRFLLELACYDAESKEKILRHTSEHLPDTESLRDLAKEQLRRKLKEIEKIQSRIAAQRTKIAGFRGRLRTKKLRAKERSKIANKARKYVGMLTESKRVLRKCKEEKNTLKTEVERREEVVDAAQKAHHEAEAAVTVAGIKKREYGKDLDECECA